MKKDSMTRRHWGRYLPNTSADPYRLCLECGHWMRNWYAGLPLIHKGKKPRWRRR